MSARGGASLRLGIVGCGRIVERGYVPAALTASGVELTALADPDAGRLGRCAELWEEGGAGPVKRFSDAEALLASKAVDALIVATPPATHAEIAALSAAAGVPGLVEKPPAADLDGARRLARLDPPPRLAFNRRFLQGVELAAAVPADGWLEIDLEFRYRREAWAAHEVRDDALLDVGIHLIDLGAFLSGSVPICVRGAVVEPERAEFELELGRGRARISCATDRRHRERVEVRDRAGRTLVKDREGGVRGRLAALRGAPDPLVVSIRRQLEALKAAVEGDPATALGSAQDGVRAMVVVEAARRSAGLGGAEVTVDGAEVTV